MSTYVFPPTSSDPSLTGCIFSVGLKRSSRLRTEWFSRQGWVRGSAVRERESERARARSKNGDMHVYIPIYGARIS